MGENNRIAGSCGKRGWLHRAGIAVCGLLLTGLAGAQSDDGTPGPVLANEFDVIYDTAPTGSGNAELRLDIYQPSAPCTAPRPFVLMIHGGGFRHGSKSDAAWVEIAETVSAAGYVSISIDYRLEGETPLPSDAFAAMRDRFLRENAQQPPRAQDVSLINAVVSATEDACSALAWVQTQAEARCIDPQRFAVWGSSAGALIGHTISYGLDDFGVETDQPDLFLDYWGRPAFPGLMAAGDPPIFMLHGTADTTVPFSFAQSLEGEAIAERIPYELHPVDGGTHGFGGTGVYPPDGTTPSRLQVTLEFLDAHLPL